MLGLLIFELALTIAISCYAHRTVYQMWEYDTLRASALLGNFFSHCSKAFDDTQIFLGVQQ